MTEKKTSIAHGKSLSSQGAERHIHENSLEKALAHKGQMLGATTPETTAKTSKEFSLDDVPLEFRQYDSELLKKAHALIEAANKPKELGGYTLGWYEAILTAKSHFPSRT